MSVIVSIADEMRVAELREKLERGEALDAVEVAFLEALLDVRETELVEALRPWRRL
jgi:hypothetical protein